ncbi:MAG: TIM44-like domain-containing protein [Methylococcales bacterium]|nr:TIM44-like domain-containing protein [Methylococcales bacterium]
MKTILSNMQAVIRGLAVMLVALMLVLLFGLATAQARPGGGHSSHSFSHSSSSSHRSSGSSHSYSGGSYNSGNTIRFSQPLPPLLVIVLLIIILIVVITINKQINSQQQSFIARPTDENRSLQQSVLKAQLDRFKQTDTNFSGILFLDFVHSLYSKFYSYSTHPEFTYLSPFLSTELQQHFQGAGPWTVNEVVINGIKWLEVNSQGSETDTISVDIDANYTLHQQDKRTRYAVQERWRFYRQKGVTSPEPEKMQTLCCPHCGAPAHFTDAGVCGHCGSVIQKGGMQWYLGKRVVLGTVALASNDLVSYAEEQGSQLPSIKSPDLIEAMNQFQQAHGLSDWQTFWGPFENDTVKAYFLAIYTQWSQRDWQAVRHLLSDRLYEANAFWQTLYSENDWYNRLDNLLIKRVELVKIDMDTYYEAITVRIFAACNDYTEDARGKLIGGSKKIPRQYTEYWTFVRRTGQEAHSKPYSLSQCPQCGAPADNMGQSAECGYCGSKISTGQFSWVVFLITQDEVYEG